MLQSRFSEKVDCSKTSIHRKFDFESFSSRLLDIKRAAERIREIVPEKALKLPSYDTDVLIENLRMQIPEDRQNDQQYIVNLLEDTRK